MSYQEPQIDLPIIRSLRMPTMLVALAMVFAVSHNACGQTSQETARYPIDFTAQRPAVDQPRDTSSQPVGQRAEQFVESSLRAGAPNYGRYPLDEMMRWQKPPDDSNVANPVTIKLPALESLPAVDGQSESSQQANAESKTIDLPAADDVIQAGDSREGDFPSPGSTSTVPAKTASAKKAVVTSTAATAGQAVSTGDVAPAAQPKPGDHFFDDRPCTDNDVVVLPFEEHDFAPDAVDSFEPTDPWLEMDVYQGKHLNCNQRPWLEIGRPFYDYGQYRPSGTILGDSNLLAPQLLVFGDWRTAAASNVQNGNELTQIATRLNLELDLKLTATERFHAFVRPFDQGAEFTRVEFDSGETRVRGEFDFEFEPGFFEGDLGAIVGGATGEVLPFDLPFAVGQIPLVLQNGIWLEDGFLGLSATIPARNSRLLDISNFDTTFFWGFDGITSPVFQGDDDAGKMYGVTSFLDALDGYIEVGYVFLDDRRDLDRSYHNAAIGYTRRYGKRLSNSVRIIANAGQDPSTQGPNADGVLLLVENSLITRKPYSVVPYFNMFAGFGRPQSVARAAGSGGILRNTGINFETDGLTNYPTLDATGSESYGGALGINLLGDQLTHQLVFEMAFLQTMGEDALRPAVADQYAVGTRYQLPLTNSVLLRADAMYGFLESDDNISGMRLELRKKF